MNSIDRIVATLALDHQALSQGLALAIIERANTDPAGAEEMLFTEVPEATLLGAIAKEMNYTYVNLHASRAGLRSDVDLQARADNTILRQISALPMRESDGEVAIIAANPSDPDMVTYVNGIYGSPKIYLGSKSQIQARLALSGPTVAIELDDEFAPPPSDTPTRAQPRNPVVVWVDSILENAVAQDASDVHFEYNDAGHIMLRFRVDGLLRSHPAPLRGRESEVIGILMNRSGMDSANQREPQDGAFTFSVLGRKIDVRAAMLPQMNGVSMVLRLLDSTNVRRRLIDMGFSQAHITELTRAIHLPQGTIIVCGPTGSGKTTTLYALVREVAAIEKNVVTIEDPPEYRLPLVNQTAITRSADGRALNFARALRAIMRMDPDVILVGEVRDAETAKTAMDAAITGHLVLSTVHTRDAVGIYTRLAEMGVPNYLVADAMTLGVSQRLARRVHSCAEISAPTESETAAFETAGVPVPALVPHPVGCDGCDGSGYQGRVAIVEVLNPTRDFRELVLIDAGHDALLSQAISDGFVPMIKEGLRLATEGTTTVAEALRVVESD
jgi:type II secretory ATPase GspE/PulE/Tfp pilus assembly ATPase PilB-like protein